MGRRNNEKSSLNVTNRGGRSEGEKLRREVEDKETVIEAKRRATFLSPSFLSLDWCLLGERRKPATTPLAYSTVDSHFRTCGDVNDTREANGILSVPDSTKHVSPTSRVGKRTLQMCSRCLSPILGHRRKSKICELCTAKRNYVITNEFSELKLEQRRAALFLKGNSYSRGDRWSDLRISTSSPESSSRLANSSKSRRTSRHCQQFQRFHAFLRYNITSSGLCSPPNVFPFGSGIDSFRDNDRGENVENVTFQAYNNANVSSAMRINAHPVWRPF